MPEAHPHLREIHLPRESTERADIGERTQEQIITSGLFPPLTRRYGIILCGLSEAREGFHFVRRHPEMWQVLVCLEGAGEIWNIERDLWERCTGGTAFVTPPEVFHAYRALPDAPPWQLAWVMLPAASIAAGISLPIRIAADGEPLAASIRGLHAETLRPDGGEPLVTESWAALVRAYAVRLCVAATRQGAPTGDPRLQRLFATVVADLAHPWDLKALAARIGVSGEHLRRLCHAEGIASPMRRVTELRMRHAAALLASGFYTVERAAARVGYENPFAFSTAFKRVLGRSPSAFRPLP